MNLLLIEDDKEIVSSLAPQLKERGFVVDVAFDGEEGFWQAIFRRPDLIIFDILTPKMDGMETVKKLREHSAWGKKVPIILLANLIAGEKTRREIAVDEPTYYFIKSDWKIPNIIDEVRKLFRSD